MMTVCYQDEIGVVELQCVVSITQNFEGFYIIEFLDGTTFNLKCERFLEARCDEL